MFKTRCLTFAVSLFAAWSSVVAGHFADASYVADPSQPPRRVTRNGAGPAAARSAADFAAENSFTSGIQEAVDALPRSGSQVYVPPGNNVPADNAGHGIGHVGGGADNPRRELAAAGQHPVTDVLRIHRQADQVVFE